MSRVDGSILPPFTVLRSCANLALIPSPSLPMAACDPKDLPHASTSAGLVRYSPVGASCQVKPPRCTLVLKSGPRGGSVPNKDHGAPSALATCE